MGNHTYCCEDLKKEQEQIRGNSQIRAYLHSLRESRSAVGIQNSHFRYVQQSRDLNQLLLQAQQVVQKRNTKVVYIVVDCLQKKLSYLKDEVDCSVDRLADQNLMRNQQLLQSLQNSSKKGGQFMQKKQILQWIQEKLSVETENFLLFYSGRGSMSGDWIVQNKENPLDNRINLAQIMTIWKQMRKVHNSHLYIFMNSSFSGNWCYKLKELRQATISIFALCGRKYENVNGLPLLSFFCLDDNQLLQKFEILERQQNPIYIHKSEIVSNLTLDVFKKFKQNRNNLCELESSSLPTRQDDNFHVKMFGQNKYEGELQNGLKQGFGTLYFQNGDVHVGFWKKDEKNGKGETIFSNNDIFYGQFAHNLKNGKGKYIWADGEYYEGDWLNDNQHGIGVYSYLSGNRYDGQWVNDKRTGKGQFSWPNGDKYFGDFFEDGQTGYGQFVWSNGDCYKGGWLNGKQNGRGQYFANNGNIFIGNFQNGNRHGNGKCIYSNGDKQEGMWTNLEEKQFTFVSHLIKYHSQTENLLDSALSYVTAENNKDYLSSSTKMGSNNKENMQMAQ